ncbi:hypothetical protein Lser_V15G05067 [Lactuca serriola]
MHCLRSLCEELLQELWGPTGLFQPDIGRGVADEMSDQAWTVVDMIVYNSMGRPTLAAEKRHGGGAYVAKHGYGHYPEACCCDFQKEHRNHDC